MKEIIKRCSICKGMEYLDSVRYRENPNKFALNDCMCDIAQKIIKVLGERGNSFLLSHKEFLEAKEKEKRNILDAHSTGRLPKDVVKDYIEAINEEIWGVLDIN